MTRFGYTLMAEQSGPKDLVRYAVSAEHRGFAGATHFVRPEEAAEPLLAELRSAAARHSND
jgi:hypothetical protein